MAAVGRPLLAIGVLLVVFVEFMPSAEAACFDRINTCDRVRYLCRDAKVGRTIRGNCNLTCGVCKPSRRRGCVDNPRCGTWIAQGYCSSFAYTRLHKQQNCPKACRLCPKSRAKRHPKKKGHRGRPHKKTPRKKPHKKRPQPKSKRSPRKYAPFQEAMDESVNPCTDFFRFACGSYVRRHDVSRPRSNFDTIADVQARVNKQHMALIMDKTPSKSKAVRMMQAFRDSCLNVEKVDSERSNALWNTMKSIGGGFPMLTNGWTAASFNLQDVLLKLTAKTGTSFLYAFTAQKMIDGKVNLVIQPADMIVRDVSVYADPAASKAKFDALADFVSELVGLLAADQKLSKTYAEIATAVEDTIKFEFELVTQLFKKKWNLATGDPDPFSAFNRAKFSNLKTLVTQINWDDFVRDTPLWDAELKAFLQRDPEVLFYNDEILKAADAFFKAADPRRLANYLFVTFLIRKSPYLDLRFAAAANRFATKIDANPQTSTRPQDCLGLVVANFQIVSDHLYTTKYVPQATTRLMDRMIEDLRSGLSTIIRGEKWMDSRTKASALRKLSKTKKVIAAVDEARDPKKFEAFYSDLNLDASSQSLGEMAVQISEHAARINLKQLLDQYLGITLDPQTRVDQVNAFSMPTYNTIYMSAAILQPPFADPKQPAAVNYGSIGYVVGHEFSHLFDDQGMDFDEIGAKRNWWSDSARRQFQQKAKCLTEQFSKQVEPHVRKHLNGSLTLGENIADSAGIRASFRAYKHRLNGRRERHVLGYSKYSNEQTFFISFARTWCTANSLDVINTQLAIDTHSPNQFRVNMVVSNFPEFSKAFKCRRGTKMNPRKQCVVW